MTNARDVHADENKFFQETVALPRENLETRSPADIRVIENTIVIPRNGRAADHDPVPAARRMSGRYRASAEEKAFFKQTLNRKPEDPKYTFHSELLSGGMGAILKVLDQDLNRISAMKVILPEYKTDPDSLKSLIREAKITGLLEHPNIIPVHDLGLLEDAGVFFTMKLARGGALNAVLEEIAAGSPAYLEKYNRYRLLSIFRKVCDALSFAHSKKIIHQDIKPHNIMVGRYGEVLLMDWGLANYIGDPEKEDDPLKKEILRDILVMSAGGDDLIKGSPPYMAPEQVAGDPDLVDHRTDIFLLGATLYHMVTLCPPYFGADIYDVLHKAENRELTHPQTRNPKRQIPEEICGIILKAMAADKADRYQSVEEMAEDVDDVISGKWSKQDVREFSPGELLMREGELGEEAYLITSGKVQVYKQADNQKIVFGNLTQGDIVGEMALITDEARSASVEALEKTQVSVLTKDVLSQNLKKLPPFMDKIISTLSERLSTANTRINIHSTTDCTYVVLQQLRLIVKDKSNNRPEQMQFSAPKIMEEISENLSLPVERVESVLKNAADIDLLRMSGKQIGVPDFGKLTQFTNFAKMVAKIPLKHRELLLSNYISKMSCGGRNTPEVRS